MRKLFIALAFVGLSTSAMAQNDVVPTQKYSVATNSFWANWFVSAGVDFNAAYTSQEKLGNVNPFSVDRGTFGFNVAVGKWFTPSIGLRTKFQGLWAKKVINADVHPSYGYWNLHEDVMFNLSNMFCGYNKDRIWNFIPYVGLGVMRNMSDNSYDLSYNVGFYNTFKVCDRAKVFVDLYATATEGSLDNGEGYYEWNKFDKFSSRHWDKLVGLSVGVTYDISPTNTWEKTPDVDALMAMNKEQMDALNASLKDQKDENARLREMLANQPKASQVVEKAKVVATAQSVFFNIGSAKIASRKDLVNVKEVAEYAKANGSKVVVTGYADSKTGSSNLNQQLSEKRANAVVDELVKMGVNRDNIVVEAKGGVDTITPFSYNRRVTVQLQ